MRGFAPVAGVEVGVRADALIVLQYRLDAVPINPELRAALRQCISQRDLMRERDVDRNLRVFRVLVCHLVNRRGEFL